MTTPANVTPQAIAPVRSSAGGTRDNSARGSAGNTAGDDQQGFGDVLTKLQHADIRQAGGKSSERANLDWPDAEPSPDTTGAASAVDLALAELVVEDVQSSPDAQEAPVTPQSAANPMGALAAAIASAQRPTSGNPAPTQAKEADPIDAGPMPAAPPEAIVPDIPEPDLAIADGPDDVPARQVLAAAADPGISGAASRASGADKEKLARKPTAHANVAPSAASPTARSVEPQQPATASVRRQEVHFPPVTANPQAPGERAPAPDLADTKPPDASAAADVMTVTFDDLSAGSAKPVQQIADQILREVAASDTVERTVTVPVQNGAKSALKVLHIQLQPADLGTVTVRLELIDSALSVEVEADRPATADMLRNDQDTLSKLLKSAGYAVDVGTVRIADADRAAASQQLGQGSSQSNFQSSPQSQSGASERQQQQFQRGGSGSSGENRSQASRNDNNETTAPRAGRGLYI